MKSLDPPFLCTACKFHSQYFLEAGHKSQVTPRLEHVSGPGWVPTLKATVAKRPMNERLLIPGTESDGGEESLKNIAQGPILSSS